MFSFFKSDNKVSEDSRILTVTDSVWKQEVLESPVPVLVDFWAPWCAPCRRIAPVVEDIAREYEGLLKVVKLNTDENFETASRYGIMSIPTLAIFKGGTLVDTMVGALPKTQIVKKITPHIVTDPAS
ncbi:MAG: thioredoxin [Chlorobi bacterium]|nr:thioredoxin [Chlorobiota bacterium]